MGGFWSHVFKVVGLLILLIGIGSLALPFTDLLRGATICIVGLGVMLIGSMPELQKLSVDLLGGKLTAEAREVITEARDVTEELRKFAKFFGTEALKQIVSSGRWGGAGTLKEKFDNQETLLAFLSDLGLSKNDIQEVRASVSMWHRIDYCSVIGDIVLGKYPQLSQTEWTSFWEKWNGSLDRPPPSELKEFLEQHDWDDPQLWAWFEDYEHYWETNTHLRPDEFRRRAEVQETVRSKL